MSKDDELMAKINLEAIVTFMKKKFDNLGTIYQMSNLGQIRVLLCSIFPLDWLGAIRASQTPRLTRYINPFVGSIQRGSNLVPKERVDITTI
jgi:hypothetical protein